MSKFLLSPENDFILHKFLRMVTELSIGDSGSVYMQSGMLVGLSVPASGANIVLPAGSTGISGMRNLHITTAHRRAIPDHLLSMSKRCNTTRIPAVLHLCDIHEVQEILSLS
jgi:hypothetical protein